MAWTQEDLDKINRMIASGTRHVTFQDGRAITYDSLAEKMAAKREIEAALRQQAAGKPRPSFTLAQFSRR